MQKEKERIEIHKKVEKYAVEFLREMTAQGIKFEIVARDRLKISGEMTSEQIELIKLKKTLLISALSPKCKNCGLTMNLIESAEKWFCPFGCGSYENK